MAVPIGIDGAGPQMRFWASKRGRMKTSTSWLSRQTNCGVASFRVKIRIGDAETGIWLRRTLRNFIMPGTDCPVSTGDRASRRERRPVQIPAFTADAAVYRSSNPYYAAAGAGWEGRIAAPQVSPSVSPIQPLCSPCPPEGGGSQTCCIWIRQCRGLPGGPIVCGPLVRHCWTAQCPPSPDSCHCSEWPKGSCESISCHCVCNGGTPLCCDGTLPKADPGGPPVHCPPSCPGCGFACS